jgi:hypothetical protein
LHANIEFLVGDRGLDYLVNNAGRNYTVPATDVDFDEVQQTFEVNVFSVMRMCQTFVPELIKAKGTIVQIGSVSGVIPYVFGSAYNASKAALHSYSNTLRTVRGLIWGLKEIWQIQDTYNATAGTSAVRCEGGRSHHRRGGVRHRKDGPAAAS